MDSYGNVVKVFIDVVSFFGDYPAVTAMTDVRGHTATAFCTFCTMRKMDVACGRNLLYSSKYHGRRLGFMRFDERTDAIRSANPPDDLVQALGLSRQPSAYAANAPLVRYSRRIRELKEKGVRPPFSMSFDSFLNVAAAPDHLFTGMIESNALYGFTPCSWLCARRMGKTGVLSRNCPVRARATPWEGAA